MNYPIANLFAEGLDEMFIYSPIDLFSSSVYECEMQVYPPSPIQNFY